MNFQAESKLPVVQDRAAVDDLLTDGLLLQSIYIRGMYRDSNSTSNIDHCALRRARPSFGAHHHTYAQSITLLFVDRYLPTPFLIHHPASPLLLCPPLETW